MIGGNLTPAYEGVVESSAYAVAFTGMALAAACLLQFGVSVFIDHRYERGLFRSLYWVIWYPLAYWLISLLTTLCGFPMVMLRRRRARARWESPDRGIKAPTS